VRLSFWFGHSKQCEAEDNDVVTVNLKFQPIQSIVVNSDQKTVDLLYATTTNYANGVSVEEPSPFLVSRI